MIHHVKSWIEYFQAIKAGTRTRELRRNDRDYQVGDFMILAEFDPATQEYTGNTQEVEITAMTSSSQTCAVSNEALHSDFCILSIRRTNFIPMYRRTHESLRAI